MRKCFNLPILVLTLKIYFYAGFNAKQNIESNIQFENA